MITTALDANGGIRDVSGTKWLGPTARALSFSDRKKHELLQQLQVLTIRRHAQSIGGSSLMNDEIDILNTTNPRSDISNGCFDQPIAILTMVSFVNNRLQPPDDHHTPFSPSTIHSPTFFKREPCSSSPARHRNG